MSLKQLRGKQITQSKLASKLNVSQSYISAWEKNTREPSIKQIPKLAEILHCTIEEIVYCFCD